MAAIKLGNLELFMNVAWHMPSFLSWNITTWDLVYYNDWFSENWTKCELSLIYKMTKTNMYQIVIF